MIVSLSHEQEPMAPRKASHLSDELDVGLVGIGNRHHRSHPAGDHLLPGAETVHPGHRDDRGREIILSK